ncbi:hypothetical protein EIN_287740 [Entamoeba invadens IP1]|uniref:PARP catalytic domain-containing protein n=1 Tax=Entamoeba invadens IP1 TaxID=370355 RepID=A0A0A1U4X3_ENTIV|nr:hypothetical protein EIN_287740 [Entamoeba invadens IP1]ELP89348.1 hypothetical protein EIN_287740 [Entamoeba invadens IP1]|eukprot:XP_004256119.1 hypothetical protein EIN_287740 [Entamoeba invadens IP1]
MNSIEDECTAFCTTNPDFCLLEYNSTTSILHMIYVPDDKEFDLLYIHSHVTTPSRYILTLTGKKYDRVVTRCVTTWQLTPPYSLTDALNQLATFLYDEKTRLQTLSNDVSYQKKQLSDRLDKKRAEIRRTSQDVFSFDTEVAYNNLKADIIESFLHSKELGFVITAVDDNPYHWVIDFNNFDTTTHIGRDMEHLMELSLLDSVKLDLQFSSTMFPVIPPKYNFVSPKLYSHTLKMIFTSGAFERDVYNPLTKIEFLKNIRKVIERYAQIDFGVSYNTVEDYSTKDNMKEQNLAKPFLGQLIQKGREFVDLGIDKFNTFQPIWKPNLTYQPSATPKNLIKKENSIQFNSYLLDNCPAMERFLIAKEMVNFGDIDTDGFFCWHGSNDVAINGICMNGFDPNRRCGQAMGVGEYFAADPLISVGYSKGNSHLILAYVLRPSNKSLLIEKSKCYVVNNPLNWEYSYCLPLLVITFGDGHPVNFLGETVN